MSSFTKFEIYGPQACALLQYLAVANVDKQVGGATYTQLCNERGGIEADVTIIRRSRDCFWLITGSALGIRDRHWIESHVQGNLDHAASSRQSKSAGFSKVEVRDITSAYGVINLAGPLARKVLEKVCDEDVSHENFPFMAAKDIRIGYAPALAYRVTYIGELGWELYIPTEYVQYVYEELQQAGEEFDITNIGYRAIDSLRLEKRYLAWGIDITPDYNPFEAGLQFLIDWNKGDFLGAQALAKIKQEGVQQKLVCLALEDPLPVFGGEAIFCDGKVVAQTTSGNFSYSAGNSLVLAYLPVDVLERSDFTVDAFGERSAASIVKGAIYDPKREKILC
jgi:4-methylaminobutanoate oxidase (formaldehyde-forming)